MEVSVGTSRNFKYYKHSKCTSIVGIDQSESMILESNYKLATNFKELSSLAQFQVMNAQALTFGDKSFDTVVDTFGLCSCKDPVQTLREMQRVCKDDGKILLLEHGRSNYAWLNERLDKGLTHHASRWGCFWNRDILKIVEEAGLTVDTVRRFHFGTTYYIIAKPAGLQKESEAK